VLDEAEVDWLPHDPLRGSALQMRRQHHAAVSPPNGGRQNDPLGFGEFCRRHVRDPPGSAARAAATTAAPLRRQRRRGRIPEKRSPQDDNITAPFAAECQSFLRLFLMLFCVHPIRKCRPLQTLFITFWLEVPVLPAPPRSSGKTLLLRERRETTPIP